MERLRLRIGFLMTACAIGLAGPAARATAVCGSIVMHDVTLAGDLVCSGDGLVVGASGIRIDLNGFAIQGSGAGAGVAVTGHSNVTIVGGGIRQFAVGIRVSDATDLEIRRMDFTGNAEGIDFQGGSVHNTVKDSAFRQHGTRAIMLRNNSRDNEIKANTFIDNRLAILVFGGVDSSIKNNFIAGSSVGGIRLNVFATGNVVKDNILTGNAAGMEFLFTSTATTRGNELKANTLAGNGCGIKGPAEGNDVHDNSFDGNTVDSCL